MKKVSCLAWSKIRCLTIMRTALVNFFYFFFHNSNLPRWQNNFNMEQSCKWFDFCAVRALVGGLWLSNYIPVFICYTYTLQYFVQNTMCVYSLFEKKYYTNYLICIRRQKLDLYFPVITPVLFMYYCYLYNNWILKNGTISFFKIMFSTQSYSV